MHTIRPLLLSWLATSALLAAQQEPFRVASIFGDHMVLPAAREVPVHGHGPIGAKVTLRPSWGEPVVATVGRDGRFRATIRTAARGEKGRLQLACAGSEQVLDDILFGDVWLASGQSNMEWTLNDVKDQAAIDAAEHPDLRVFTVTRRTADTPADDVDGEWAACTPEVAKELSAVGYFFASGLLQAGHGPIGLVCSSWGGTPCQAWTSAEGLREFPEFQSALAAQQGGGMERLQAARREQFFAAIDALPMAEAVDVELPEVWSAAGLGGFDGVVDYRRRIVLPAELVGRELRLELGAIDDMDRVLWNASRVAGSEQDGVWNVARDYTVPASRTGEREVELVVRVVDTGGEGGFTGTPQAMKLSARDGGGPTLPLFGSWQRIQRGSLDQLPKWPRAGGGPNRPAVLWNGMIEPLLPFAFAGVIWYQGESNRGDPDQYARLFPAMIRDWRRAFATELPFYFVQIAPYKYTKDGNDLAARLREAQAAALQLPATGMVVTLDCGNPKDIHPRNKRPVGDRLARLARHYCYGEQVACESPRAVRAERDGSRVRVHFAEGHGRLELVEPDGFHLLDAERRIRRANARIDGDVLVLEADEPCTPQQVFYAYSEAPSCSLRDDAGLPAAPFRLVVE